MAIPDPILTLRDVQAAAERIADHVHHPPLVTNPQVDARAGRRVWLATENLQRGGSFKARGAINRCLRLSEEERRRGVIACSSGNHAQGVALAARRLGVPATVVMPENAVPCKLAAARYYGATVVQCGTTSTQRQEQAWQVAEERGLTMIHPYEDPLVMAGQGTLGLEILARAPAVQAVLVPIGGGGLIAGMALAIKATDPRVKVFGVEPALANDAWLSLQKGERVTIPEPPTIADGVRALHVGEPNFPLIREYVDAVFLVSEEEILDTMRFLMSRTKLVVEPTGAVAPAAALTGKLPAGLGPVAAVISGGNLDVDRWRPPVP